jgi:hypothetical protein
MAQGPYWPAFESPFLDAVVKSLRKRSKSLGHKCKYYDRKRVWEVDGAARREKAELSFSLLGPHPVGVACHLWDDRWIWVDVRQPAKRGWVFEWQHQGRIGASEPRLIAQAIEKTLDIHLDNDAGRTANLVRIWLPLAAMGPRDLV